MSNTLVRFALIALIAFSGVACGDDDGIVHRDAGFSVLDTGNSGRLDAGARDSGTNPGDSGQSRNDSGSVQTDASTQPPTDAM